MTPGLHSFKVECEDFNGNIVAADRLVPDRTSCRSGTREDGHPAGTYHIDPDNGGKHTNSDERRHRLAMTRVRSFRPWISRIADLDEPDARGIAIEPHGIPLDGGFVFRLTVTRRIPNIRVRTPGAANSWTFHLAGRTGFGRDGHCAIDGASWGMSPSSMTPSPLRSTGFLCSGSDPKPRISFRFRDNLSGVEYKEVKVYIDGIMVIPEIDGEHRRAFAQPSSPLAKGSHRLTILVSDHMGNRADVERSFHVR